MENATQTAAPGARAPATPDPLAELKGLELGCGRTKRPGFIGLDVVPLPGVDVVHDVNAIPWPFPDNRFQEVYAIHLLEHVKELLPVMEEIWRVLEPGGRLVLTTPHYSGALSWQDPTHRHHLHSRSFDYFDPDYKTNYYTAARFRAVRIHIRLHSLWRTLGFGFLVNLQNRHRRWRFLRRAWENYLSFIIRASVIEAELIAVKE